MEAIIDQIGQNSSYNTENPKITHYQFQILEMAALILG